MEIGHYGSHTMNNSFIINEDGTVILPSLILYIDTNIHPDYKFAIYNNNVQETNLILYVKSSTSDTEQEIAKLLLINFFRNHPTMKFMNFICHDHFSLNSILYGEYSDHCLFLKTDKTTTQQLII